MALKTLWMGNGHVLVVDDDPLYVRALSRILVRADYDVTTAGDGLTALEMVVRAAVDVVVSDLEMPVMSGMALLRSLRKQAPHVGFVMMTGLVGPAPREEAIALGAAAYLVKPFDPQALVAAVRGIVVEQKKRSARHALAR